MTELQETFVSYYNDNVLLYLNCTLNRKSSDNWLARLVRKPDGSQHPLQHLLLMHFLRCSVEAFFSRPPNYLPFGIGPWPCLNAASDHYRQYSIEKCKIIYGSYIGGRPLGIFSCACGFIYSRTGPDKSIEDQFRFGRIKTFGEVWETKLQILWQDEAVSLRGIARQLGVDPLTVKRYATRLGLPFPRRRGKSLYLSEKQQLRPLGLTISRIDILEGYKAKWLALLQANHGAGIKKLRSEAPGVYTWLYRNDKVWLKEHMPVPAKINKTGCYRINWAERDAQLAEEVKIVVLHLKNLPGRPVHITITSIGREIGQLALLQQHLDKLPRTAERLEEYAESRAVFAVRRVQWIVADCIQRRIKLQKWQLIRRAGIERLLDDELVKSTLNVALQELLLNGGIFDNER